MAGLAPTLLLVVLMLCSASAWNTNRYPNVHAFGAKLVQQSKKILPTAAGLLLVSSGAPQLVHAGVDPSELMKVAGKAGGTTLGGDFSAQMDKVKELQKAQDTLDAADIEFTQLRSGSSYREFRTGKGSKEVRKGSNVIAEMTIRCKSFATQQEPGGVKYYDSRLDGDLNWQVGSGALPAALEDAMIGMKRGSVRRIELPSMLVFDARKDGQLPQATEKNPDGQRRYKSLFKTDATLIFEVLVDKIIDPVEGTEVAAN
jgi:hypothetical protein